MANDKIEFSFNMNYSDFVETINKIRDEIWGIAKAAATVNAAVQEEINSLSDAFKDGEKTINEAKQKSSEDIAKITEAMFAYEKSQFYGQGDVAVDRKSVTEEDSFFVSCYVPMTMRMKKILLFLLICFTFGFVSCGSDKDKITNGAQTPIYIREGYSSLGTILYNIDGQYIREGYSSLGTILYNIDGQYIREGYSSLGTILYNIDGQYIREGYSSLGTILYNIGR